jgi:hypothetical protein
VLDAGLHALPGRSPLDELESRLLWHPTAAGTVVAGVVPAHVGSVHLILGRTEVHHRRRPVRGTLPRPNPRLLCDSPRPRYSAPGHLQRPRRKAAGLRPCRGAAAVLRDLPEACAQRPGRLACFRRRDPRRTTRSAPSVRAARARNVQARTPQLRSAYLAPASDRHESSKGDARLRPPSPGHPGVPRGDHPRGLPRANDLA